MADVKDDYPVKLNIEYPDRSLNKLTTFFRIFTVIPIAIVLALLSGGQVSWQTPGGWEYNAGSTVVLFLPVLLMILFQQKYPRWWFDWNVAIVKFSIRVGTYLALMNDQYPSIDDEQWVKVEIPYPDVKQDLKHWMPLVKWFLAIPHYIVLGFLWVAVVVVVIIAWFAILFTGRYPRDFFDFIVKVIRWTLRVDAYAFLLVTDIYPPFSLS